MAQKTEQKNLIGQQEQNRSENKTDPNQLLLTWLRTVKFNDTDKTSVNIKLYKNKEYLNTKMLIKTNDYKQNQSDGSVTINFQLTIQALKDLNRFTYNALKTITEHMKEKETMKRN